MLTLGAIGFLAPWLLAGLAALPLLWWLLRLTPPAPRMLHFPAVRLLFGLESREETPTSSPWWLILLRLAAAALVILGLAHPLINPGHDLAGSGPIVLAVDDGWAAARDWPARQQVMRDAIGRAERDSRPVVLLTTAPNEAGEAPSASGLLTPGEARGLAESLVPKPWPVDRKGALAALDAAALPGSATVLWLSDGLDDPDARGFAERLQRLGALRILARPLEALPRLLLPPEGRNATLELPLRRVPSPFEERVVLTAGAADGRPLANAAATFEPGQGAAAAAFDVPLEIRNQILRVSIDGESTAGSVVLIDERWRRRPVGLAAPSAMDEGPALLSDRYFIERALAPFSAVRRGPVETLIADRQAVIILPDSHQPGPAERAALERWVQEGGLLLRFAGPRAARAEPDPLMPVRLRGGGRTLDGAMLWSRPARLQAFPPDSPFAGLEIPGDVTVSRQVLAEPSLDLAEKTWARLTDGTPLVTAERRGQGWLVLIHTTANTEWTSLPLSGLFVDMLRRIVGMSRGIAESGGDRPLPPLSLLDGYGRMTAATGSARAIPAGGFAAARVGPDTPPGLYGSDDERRALNLGPQIGMLTALGAMPSGIARGDYVRSQEVDLKPWLLGAALLLLLADTLVTLAMRGLLRGPRLPRRQAAAGLVALLVLGLTATSAFAQRGGGDAFAMEAALSTHLAYVVTGNPELDRVSAAGLAGLSGVLMQRTAVELGQPVGVDPRQDELAFFALLYWPVSADQAPLDAATVERLNRYMEMGGTILFDTRDQNMGGLDSGPNAMALRLLTEGLGIPPLTAVPSDHVLTKAFYLMQNFPGRWSGSRVWVERPGDRVNDGVSRVVIGANDWASAWATDEGGRPAFAVVPGGETQREWAYRFGVNLVMYALTGNYKADQVHVPAILERLGK
ncbi:MAG: DUF4159 domain-containing protein [Alphaproteobacteria bacterium]